MIFHLHEPGTWPEPGPEGFIHASSLGQLEATANRYYAGAERLAALEIDERSLDQSTFRYDVATGGQEFPHIYAPLARTSVVGTHVLERDPRQQWVLPAALSVRRDAIGAIELTPALRIGDEREVLISMLDHYRAAAVLRAFGVSDADAAKALFPGGLTIIGILKHLTLVERYWFLEMFLDRRVDDLWDVTDDDRDADFRVGEHDSVVVSIEHYLRACEASRRVTLAAALTDRCARPEHPMLRWVLVHMIEETARHCGHLDLLRELVDGERVAPAF